MAATPQQKFEAGISKVSCLRTAAAVSTDLGNEAWSALRTGIVVARKIEGVLDSCPEGEMPRVLRFMLQRAARKKSARAQVKECLRILLARPPWLAAAQAREGLRTGVREALDAEQDAELLALLAAAERAAEKGPAGASAEEAAAEASRPEEPARAPGAAAASEEPTMAAPRPSMIREHLEHGRAVLESFRWEFPCDPLGTRGDEATAGFQAILDAVTVLTLPSGRVSIGDEPSAALAGLEQDWANLLQFLVSMYNSGVKRTYSSRIRFVAAHLRSLSPAFRELAPWGSLPWGHLQMPREEAEAEARARQEEAEAEARAPEERRARRAKEAENRRLARKMREQEEAEEAALQEARPRSAQEDLTLACKLQEEGSHDEPKTWLSLFWRLKSGGA